MTRLRSQIVRAINGRPALPWTVLVLAVATSAAGALAAVDADAPAVADQAAGDSKPPTGLAALVRVNLPLTSGADAALKLTLTRARDRLLTAARETKNPERPALVLEIAPKGSAQGAGGGSQFETALSLARFLTSEMGEVKTVAWLPHSIRGHGVLVAIACEDIVMPAEAEIGEAGFDESTAGEVSSTVVAAYREIANAKRSVPVALAVGMVDRASEVTQVESEEGVRFLLRSELEEFRRDHEVINERVLAPAGSLARFTGRDARQIKLADYLANDRAGIAQYLSVPLESLQEDQSLMADWRPIMLEVRGEVTASKASQLATLLGNHVSGGANWVGVRIDSVGGELPACIDLATRLAKLDPNSVRTVAYVPVEARGGAALIALACDHLVMHPEATLGVGPQFQAVAPQDNRDLPPRPRRGRGQPPMEERPRDNEVDLAAGLVSVKELAPATERSWSLLAAMIDPGAEVFEYRNKATGEARWMSADEASSLADAVNWNRGAPLNPGNQPLALAGNQAAQLGVAWQTVDNVDQLGQLFGIDEIREVELNWALQFVHALASPGLATFLIFVGLIGAYVELKTPGVGVGGVVAAIAFILFFWSNYLGGTAGSLEIVMFIGGIVLMLLEIFVVPGIGIFGLTGGLLVIFSLVLASMTFVVPHSEADMHELSRSVTIVAGAGLAMMALAFATRRYLPKAPLFNRMVLEPPPPEERVTLASRETLADYSHLIGVAGEAVTDLRPAGKALIDDQLIDVIAEGIPLDRGTPVVVVAAHAHRVLVREAT